MKIKLLLSSFCADKKAENGEAPVDSVTINKTQLLSSENTADLNDDADDADNELQRLERENKVTSELAYSPPPTMDESMSERGLSPIVPIAAVVTLKTLPGLESPRSVDVSSISRQNSPDAVIADHQPETADADEEIQTDPTGAADTPMVLTNTTILSTKTCTIVI